MKAKICFLFLLVAIILSPLFMHLFDYYKKDHFSCWGNISFKRLEGTYSVKVRYVFNGDSGKVITIGEYNEPGLPTRKVTQNLSFKFTREGDEYTMISTLSLLTASQARLLSGVVPDFYLYEDRGLQLFIHKQGNNGLVFRTATLPIFICTLQ
ncbi:TPA: hypothetical protein JD854_RS04155 [Citrobacter amalonaticus]|uniref:Uncharacterized protein n=1 Tax=Citrobacter amalonaticus TaxID=35703 RepID=A0A9C7V169_CITAM|nr:hypothetical protein [Citrobacter amalonaticus]